MYIHVEVLYILQLNHQLEHNIQKLPSQLVVKHQIIHKCSIMQ